MKDFNKQILEAVNRGIKLALDDYEEQQNEPIAPKKDIIKKDDTVNWLIQNFVDLGLPSGTLWAKCNLGASIPEEYGNYYQWGDIEPKTDKCLITTYKFSDIDKNHARQLTKYNSEDKLTQLLLEDDAAYQDDHRMKMPTANQIRELLKYTEHKWIGCKYSNANGKDYASGIVFTGKNGNEIFIPAAGYVHDHQGLMGTECNIWSSDLLHDDDDSFRSAIYLYASEKNPGEIAEYDRFDGFSIRPVVNMQNK